MPAGFQNSALITYTLTVNLCETISGLQNPTGPLGLPRQKYLSNFPADAGGIGDYAALS